MFGSVLAREIWHERDFTRAGELFGFGRRITVLPSAGIEASIIDGSKYTIRAIEAASFQLIKENNPLIFILVLSLFLPWKRIQMYNQKPAL